MLYRYAPKRVCFILVHYGIKYIFIQRGGLRCSFYYDGQCEGLKVWDEQQVSLPRFFVSDKYQFFFYAI